MPCECSYHRYHVVHICTTRNEILDHSQGTWDEHKRRCGCRLESFPSELYEHGDTPDMLRAKATA